MSVAVDRPAAKLTVDVRRVTHVYRSGKEELIALRDLNLQLAEGERIAVIGPSGSGKTTLLNLLAGLETPTDGTIWVHARNLSTLSEHEKDEYRRRELGYAWQQAERSVWPQLNALENVLLPMLDVPVPARRSRAAALLEVVGLERRADRLPADLGYGDRRRLALAVALANHPRLLLADEVTAGLDEEQADGLLGNLSGFLRELGASAVIVAHGRHLPRHVDRLVALPYPRPVPPPVAVGRARPSYQWSPPKEMPSDRPEVLVADSVSYQVRGPDGPVPVVRGASFRVRESEMVAILGASGAGKSILLALCAGLEEPAGGSITIAGRELTGRRGPDREALLQRTLGLILDVRPPLEITPAESVALAARISGCSVPEANRLVQMALAATGLQELAGTPVGRLSGGEQVRLAVARALARAPALIIADEPTAQLDILTSMDIIGLLREAADSGIAVLLGTHYPVLAELADRVLAMSEGTLREVRRR